MLKRYEIALSFVNADGVHAICCRDRSKAKHPGVTLKRYEFTNKFSNAEKCNAFTLQGSIKTKESGNDADRVRI